MSSAFDRAMAARRDALARAPRSGTKSREAIDRFLLSFRRHVEGRGIVDQAAMWRAAKTPYGRYLVTVPELYRTAWRMMFDVPRGHVAEAIGRDPGGSCSGACARPSHVTSPSAFRVSSWSVSLDAIRVPERGFTNPTSTSMLAEGDGLVVLLGCPIPAGGGRPRRWWFNPDELYSAADADYEYQREVICVGSPGPVWLACAGADGDSTVDDLAERVASWAPQDDDLAAFVRRCRRPPT